MQLPGYRADVPWSASELHQLAMILKDVNRKGSVYKAFCAAFPGTLRTQNAVTAQATNLKRSPDQMRTRALEKKKQVKTTEQRSRDYEAQKL